MSDEEKKALKILNNTEWDGFMITIKNLVEKQSKEIEELKDTRSIFNMGRRSYKNEIEDKIKAKINEYKKQIEELKNSQIFTRTEYEGAIKFGQSLLEKE